MSVLQEKELISRYRVYAYLSLGITTDYTSTIHTESIILGICFTSRCAEQAFAIRSGYGTDPPDLQVYNFWPVRVDTQ